MDSNQLEKWASYIAILGALVIATDLRLAPVAWILFIVSSTLFIKFAQINGYKNIIIQSYIFIAVDVWGLFNWAWKFL